MDNNQLYNYFTQVFQIAGLDVLHDGKRFSSILSDCSGGKIPAQEVLELLIKKGYLRTFQTPDSQYDYQDSYFVHQVYENGIQFLESKNQDSEWSKTVTESMIYAIQSYLGLPCNVYEPPQTTIVPPTPPNGNGHRWVYGLLGGVLIVAVLIFGFWYFNNKDIQPPDPTPEPYPSITSTPTASQGIGYENTDTEEYLIPGSESRRVNDSDLNHLTHEELCFARNEIYARHGRQFDTPEVARYFNSKEWYHGTTPSNQFQESVLSEIERYNVDYIFNYEKVHYGGSYY